MGPRKLRLRDDVATPEPGDGEVLVQCRYVALCGTNMGPYLHDGRAPTIQQMFVSPGSGPVHHLKPRMKQRDIDDLAAFVSSIGEEPTTWNH